MGTGEHGDDQPLWTLPHLNGTVAVVTGASRGAGRGIARVLGEAGATVYVTGRSVRGRPTTDGMVGTIDETAEEITARGGVGIPVRVDHRDDAQVEALFARVRQEHGRLDLLINSVFGGNERWIGGEPFWEQPTAHWEGMFTAGVRAYLVASRYAAPLMMSQRRGLIAHVSYWDHDTYLGNLYYDLAKAAMNRMAYAMAEELRPHGIAAVALSPGWMRTERVLAHMEAGYHTPEEITGIESVEYVGRAVAALAADPAMLDKSGRILVVADVAREYGFTDIDGRQH